MPNQPKTPGRNFRIKDELYAPFLARAQRDGQTATDRIIALIKRDEAEDGEDWTE